MKSDALTYPYESMRKVVYGNNGLVCTSQPLASQAGLDILKMGGNAVDAAVSAAACLTVVEPPSCGIGGDGFALFWKDGKLHGLNSSGYAPSRLSLAELEGRDKMPKYGWLPVTVPGVVAGWSELIKAHGELSLEEVLQPAVKYAKEGYPVSPTVGESWRRAFRNFKGLEGDEFKPWFDTFAPNGSPPGIGNVWRSKDHADTLKLIGETNGDAFYRGELAEQIDRFSREHGGYLRADDLESYRPEWVDPVAVDYRGYDIWELPPNCQGMVASIALKILNGLELGVSRSEEACHKQIEAVKLAFEVGKRYFTDPNHMEIDHHELLQDSYTDDLRDRICQKAMGGPDGEETGGTVYLAAADAKGNMVSYIQSNYMGFGSGLVVPGTGIALHNRGNSFSLDPEHANSLEPGKRPFHTIIPGFITKKGSPIGPFGVMGGHMQPQGHVQVISNMVDFGLNPQSALDAPRWRWEKGKEVFVESGFPKHTALNLERKGHDIKYALHSGHFGRGQIILKDGGPYCAGTEPRADGHIAVY